MIALRHGVPLVSMPSGRCVVFNKQWIISALQQAAAATGEERWLIAFPITDAIIIYLQRDFQENSIPLHQLEQVIYKMLHSLHHDAIAACFSLPDPPVSLSLVDLVHQAGSGYELAFFQLLQKKLQGIAQSNSLRLEIEGLEPCLRLLTHRLRLGRHDVLREEIVNYIRLYGHSNLFRTTRNKTQSLEIEIS